MREGLLLGMGNPLLDISANVNIDILKKYDLQPDNAILATEKHKSLNNELIEKCNAEFLAGGSVQNAFRVAQWILQKPNIAVFFGCVGEDKYSKILEEKARKDGVNVNYQYMKNVTTGTCAVLITGMHRSLCANLGAANHFTIEHLNIPHNDMLIKNAEYFYISGYFLSVSPESAMKVAKKACDNNEMFLMNLSAPFVSEHFSEPLFHLLPYTDILFGNELEAQAFARVKDWKDTDIKVIGQKICMLPKKNSRTRCVILTQGHLPVLLFENGNITEFPVENLDRELIVDTNGAGDAFVGGFLAQLVKKKPLDACIRCGIWAARCIIQKSGCTFDGLPNYPEN